MYKVQILLNGSQKHLKWNGMGSFVLSSSTNTSRKKRRNKAFCFKCQVKVPSLKLNTFHSQVMQYVFENRDDLC